MAGAQTAWSLPLDNPPVALGGVGILALISPNSQPHSCGSLQTCFNANEVSWRSLKWYTFSALKRPFHLVLCFKCSFQILSLLLWEVRSAQSAHFAETRGRSGETSLAPEQKGAQWSPPMGYCQAVMDHSRSNEGSN